MTLLKIKYPADDWILFRDSQVVCNILGQKKGFTKFPDFLCEWVSRTRNQHSYKKQGPIRKTYRPGENVLHITLIDLKKIILSPQQNKLVLMKQIVETLPKVTEFF